MQKKIALLLCMTLLITIGLTPGAEKKVYAADYAAEVINALGIMNTDKGNTDDASALVTRARFAQMLVNLSTMKEDVTGESNVSLFSDVKKNYWAAGYIQAAINQGWMFGYLNGSFKPARGITLQEAVYGIVKILGYTDGDFSGNKVNAIMKLYTTKGLDKNIKKTKTSYLTVNDCMYLFYNTLNAKTKDGKVYATTLGYTLDSDGKLDYLSLVSTDIKGPVIVDNNWKTKIPFSVGASTMYKNGVKCSYTDIKDYDVIYYSESFKTIWIYEDKVTGTVNAVNPDYATPTSVTVEESNYTLGNSDVKLKFSSMGNYKAGDVVTLLLGKDGTVVGAVDVDEYNTTLTGFVLSKGTRLEQSGSNTYQNKNYVTFVDASGKEHKQDYDPKKLLLEKGKLIRVTYENGTAEVSEVIQDSKDFGNNTFSSDGSSLGDTVLASNVKILDIKNNSYVSVYPERLAGVIIGSSSIKYYELNDENEISQLILAGVTGDQDSYGVFTGFTYTNSTKADYKYKIGSQDGSLTTSDLIGLSTEVGPKGFVLENGTLKQSYALTGVTATSIGKTTIQSANAKYPLADDCCVYILLNGEYISTTIDKISDLSKYSVMAYYDNTISVGGRIRVIVAESLQ